MLHLTIVGNTLISLGRQPQLYSSPHIPVYPGKMVDREPVLELKLLPMGEEFVKIAIGVRDWCIHTTLSIVSFPDYFITLQVEKRDEPEPSPQELEDEHYHSLGEFYRGLQKSKRLFPPPSTTNRAFLIPLCSHQGASPRRFCTKRRVYPDLAF
jgi:hypothetical protein